MFSEESDPPSVETAASHDRESVSSTDRGMIKLLAVLCVIMLLAGAGWCVWQVGFSGEMVLQAVNDRNEIRAARLIRWGARVDARDTNGRTPLHIAAEQMDRLVCDLLIQAKADVNATDSQGNTPAHAAMDGARTWTDMDYTDEDIGDILSLLADAGADLEKKNNKGESPIDPILDELLMRKEYAESAGIFGYKKGTPKEEIDRMANDPERLIENKEAKQRVTDLESLMKKLSKSPPAK